MRQKPTKTYGQGNNQFACYSNSRIRTGLLDEDDVAKRAQARGLDVEAYFRSNLLQRMVTATDVADAFVYLAGAPSTTGCVITVDGGNIAASPR